MKYKNIVISGGIGTGKSTLARNLAKELGWEVLSAGEYFRSWHRKNNVPLNNSEGVPEEVDREIDFGYQKMMEEETGKVFESHLGGWLAKDMTEVFKVLCKADISERVKRTAHRDQVDLNHAKKNIEERGSSQQAKFLHLYGITNQFDPQFFDLVVDTTALTKEEVLKQVLGKLGEKG